MKWWAGLVSFIATLVFNAGRLLGRKEERDATESAEKWRVDEALAARRDAESLERDDSVYDPYRRD